MPSEDYMDRDEQDERDDIIDADEDPGLADDSADEDTDLDDAEDTDDADDDTNGPVYFIRVLRDKRTIYPQETVKRFAAELGPDVAISLSHGRAWRNSPSMSFFSCLPLRIR